MTLRAVDIEPADAAMGRSWNQHAIERLEEWLEAARRGELRELVMVGLFDDAEGGVTKWTSTGTRERSTRIGMLEIVKHELLTEYQDELE